LTAVPVAGVLGGLFVVVEARVVAAPMILMRLFRAPHCWALYLQSFLTGCSYFGNFSYLPLYFQTVLRHTPLASGALILTIIVPTSVTSLLAGQYIGRTGRYMPCVLAGFVLRTTCNGLTLLFDRTTGLSVLVPVLVAEGLGIGLSLQPVLMGLYANNPPRDRGAATGLRNYIRTIGGASGLVMSGVIIGNILSADLYDTGIVATYRLTGLTSSTFDIYHTNLPAAKRDIVLDVYMKGLHYIFLYHTVCSAVCLVLTAWVGNTNMLRSKITNKEAEDSEDAEMQKLLAQLRNGRIS
jgi:predicted MFS family arabinose efflux permease